MEVYCAYTYMTKDTQYKVNQLSLVKINLNPAYTFFFSAYLADCVESQPV